MFAANSCHCSAMPQVVWEIEDPSEFRPDFKLGKEKGEFRVFDNVRSLDLRPAFPSLVVRDGKLAKEYIYMVGREGRGAGRITIGPSNYHPVSLIVQKDDERYSVVERTYREMHTKQTVAFVRGMVSPTWLLIRAEVKSSPDYSLSKLVAGLGWCHTLTAEVVRRLIAHLSFHSFVRGRNGVT